MAGFKKKSILILLSLNTLFVLAYPSTDLLFLVEEKTLYHNEFPISLKIMADQSSLEYQPDFLKYPEGYDNSILLDIEANFGLESDCIKLNIFESFEVFTTLISININDRILSTTITKCEKENIIAYSINIDNYQRHSS